MRNIITSIMCLVSTAVVAQFKINITTEGNAPKEAYIYTLDGSKDILVSKEISKNNTWTLKYPKYYKGMMKAYFPENNTKITFVSENKDININLVFQNNKIKDIQYLDEANRIMDEVQSKQGKRELILPALQQMKAYYKPSSDFYMAMDKEITTLSSDRDRDLSSLPFVAYYTNNYNKFLSKKEGKTNLSQEEIVGFMAKSDDMLEASSLMRPILTEYLKNAGNNLETDVDKLLKAVDVESQRGQTILSELIDIFEAYGMEQQKNKYLDLAKGMKCEINSRLAATLKVNKNTEIGAKFPNYTFVKPTNTSAKTLYDVKANKKLIVFWSSTCSHCERDVPQFISRYNELKNKGIEIVAFSLDTEKSAYEEKIKAFPWINDSELKGWHSSYEELYNVRATPTYFILDANNQIIEKPSRLNEVFEKLGVK